MTLEPRQRSVHHPACNDRCEGDDHYVIAGGVTRPSRMPNPFESVYVETIMASCPSTGDAMTPTEPVRQPSGVQGPITVLVKETDTGWFWRVAEDWPNGRGWHGTAADRDLAGFAAAERLRAATLLQSEAVQARDDLRAMLIARGETNEAINAELALIARGRRPSTNRGQSE